MPPLEERSAPVRKVLIVGGGTAGWITAAMLARRTQRSACEVTLVESPAIPTVGVGEATVPTLVSLLRALEVDEDEFLRACGATYKLAIRFEGWRDGRDVFWHPFGLVGGTVDQVPVFHHWLRLRRLGRETRPLATWSLQALLCERGKAPRPVSGSSIVTKTGSYAYHLDASRLADFLGGMARAEGVRHVLDDVERVVLDDRGFVERVETARSGSLDADLFVDCTGFRGRILEEALGDRRLDWSDTLLCDRAVVTSVPRAPRIPPFTRATARGAGWVWRIPLAHRTGCGYVYSSAFASDEAARHELLDELAQDPERCETRVIPIRAGRRERFWRRNCVAIGLSSGFVEPLESTGIFLIQKGAELLLEHFPGRDMNETLLREYDRRMGRLYDEVRDFIVLHYRLSQREDTAFWKAAREVEPPDSLRETLALYDETGHVGWQKPHSLFGDTSFYSIASGMERLPRSHPGTTELSDVDGTLRVMEKILAQNERLAGSLPGHEALIDSLSAEDGGKYHQ